MKNFGTPSPELLDVGPIRTIVNTPLGRYSK
jgi:hypothetical protein